jgi:hypothetical protein
VTPLKCVWLRGGGGVAAWPVLVSSKVLVLVAEHTSSQQPAEAGPIQ